MISRQPTQRTPAFTNTIEALKSLIQDGPAGNRWFKVNLHVHGECNDPKEIVAQARLAEIDLIAITDHQSFRYFDGVSCAARTPGRDLTVLPGIEITSVEGVHVIGIFPTEFILAAQEQFIGWLEITGDGDTRKASPRRLADILPKIDELNGIVVVPHPFADDMGMLDSARKIGTKIEWLESGHCRLIQIAEDKVRYLEYDSDGNWLNRFVLASAQPQHITSSSYCLAPFNRSDAHKAREIGEGCSWFRMQHRTVDGLKQVSCEPRTRISRVPPSVAAQDCILGMSVKGGYCDGQFFRLNEALNCLVGQNYAGKSTVLDLIRFALGQEEAATQDSRQKLLDRLNGILKTDGTVELFLRWQGNHYVVRRVFRPHFSGRGAASAVERCTEPPTAYRFDSEQHVLVPVNTFTFPIEVYEQGRIHRLRDDAVRQLEMLDALANNGQLRSQHKEIVDQLTQSAERLYPLYDEREQLRTDLLSLSQLELELTEKEKLVPGEEEQKWAATASVIADFEAVLTPMYAVMPKLRSPGEEPAGKRSDLDTLFSQRVPIFDSSKVIMPELVGSWHLGVANAIESIKQARQSIITAIQSLEEQVVAHRERWKQAYEDHNRAVARTLSQVGVESPQELLARVATLRSKVHELVTVKKPRLVTIETQIIAEEKARESLLNRLEQANEAITLRDCSKRLESIKPPSCVAA